MDRLVVIFHRDDLEGKWKGKGELFYPLFEFCEDRFKESTFGEGVVASKNQYILAKWRNEIVEFMNVEYMYMYIYIYIYIYI